MDGGVELRQLRYFVAVAETGNITQAARKIFLTQPALSRQIKALEEEIGRPLLERHAHSIRLTATGENLLEEARRLLAHADRVLETVRAAGMETRIRVGYAPSLASGILSAAVECFRQIHPKVRVELFDLSTAELLSGLDDLRLEVSLTVNSEATPRNVKWTPLLKVKWMIAIGRKHPLAERSVLSARDLSDLPLLVFCERDYPEYRRTVTQWFQDHGLRPRIAGEHDGTESLISAVEAGIGAAIVTSRTARLSSGRARFINLQNPPEPLCIAAGIHTNNVENPVIASFVEELRRAAGAISEND